MIDVSMIIPVKNEEDNILPLAREVLAAFTGKPYQWECIWIDDGSTDRTLQRLEDLRRTDDRHRFFVFEKNAGKSAADRAGFRAARGDIICTIDGDGQNDPADLPAFIDLLKASEADMVAGYRAVRRDNWVRKFSSLTGNWFRSLLTGYTVRDTGCGTRAMKKSALLTLPYFSGMHRFLPTLFVIMGYRVVEAAANHRPRLTGEAKYGIWNRLGPGFVDCLGVYWLRKRALKYKVVKRSDQSDV
jgi:dolichol-phosphate mannosyltransferase